MRARILLFVTSDGRARSRVALLQQTVDAPSILELAQNTSFGSSKRFTMRHAALASDSVEGHCGTSPPLSIFLPFRPMPLAGPRDGRRLGIGHRRRKLDDSYSLREL
jgi:hypothetical protein